MGAALGDLLSRPCGSGGLGVGTVATGALFLVTIVSLVVYRTVTRKDVVFPIPHKRTAIEHLTSIRRCSG